MRITKKHIERFNKKISKIKNNGCIEWNGSTNRKGYGEMKIKVNQKEKSFSAHRLSYQINIGKIPKNMCVLHKCDNRKCIAPAHLFIGTYADNNHDRDLKGRFHALRGEDNGKAKLKNKEVRQIKLKLKEGFVGAHLARKYNISVHTISLIKNNKQWRHISWD